MVQIHIVKDFIKETVKSNMENSKLKAPLINQSEFMFHETSFQIPPLEGNISEICVNTANRKL